MQYRRLGKSGLKVSAIAVGCMSWGIPERGGHPWAKDEDFARQTIRQALDAGVNFFDTANVYSGGSSEEFTGRALREYAVREDYVLATKVHGRMRPGPNGAGPVPQGDPAGDRPLPDQARHGLRGPLPDPPLGPGDPDRGDDGGAARRGEGRQGPLHRCVVHVRVAVRQGPVRRRASRVDPLRLDAGPLQPALPRGGAGDAAAVSRPGRRRDPVEPAGARSAHPSLGHRDGAHRVRPVRPKALRRRRPHDRGEGARGRRAAWRASRHRSRWPGCWPSRRSPHRSSGSPGPSTCRTPLQPSTWSWASRRSRSSAPTTYHTPIAGHR